MSLCVISPSEGTIPFPTLKEETSSGSHVIHISPRRENAITVYDATGDVMSTFTIDELGFTVRERLDHVHYTTAGYQWYYPNSVTFFSNDDRFFILHLAWGKTIVLDLETLTVLTEIPNDLVAYVNNTLRSKAMALIQDPAERLKEFHPSSANRFLLEREMARERETGAMICGHLRIRKAIPRLIELLEDDSFTTISRGGAHHGPTWHRVYFVRKAALDALKAMRRRVRGVVTEEIIDSPLDRRR